MNYSMLHLFSGIGGAAIGFQQSSSTRKGVEGRFRTLAGIDVDAAACRDFERLTGSPAVCMDLFSREDYIAFHGKEPPLSWCEASPADLRAATKGECPDVVFLSPPCKGFSGLLPKKAAASEKYQALNRLTVRGLWYTMEAYADDLPGVILLENVPRITTRGKDLLRQVCGMLKAYGYVYHLSSHDCGELGGLGQRRKRFLLIARLPSKVPALIYQPTKKPLRTIGDVIGPMPLPDAPECGPMHRLPRLKWNTWVRLALIPAGGDWRDLQKIAPEEYRLKWEPRGGGTYGVQEWGAIGATVTGSTSVKGSNAAAVADKRPRAGHYRILRFDETSTTVVGAGRVGTSNGASLVADPRTAKDHGDPNRHFCQLKVQRIDEPSRTITGSSHVGGGALSIADPRVAERANRRSNSHSVRSWGDHAYTITGEDSVGSGGQSIADPRASKYAGSPGLYGVNDWGKPAPCVTGGAKVTSSNCAAAVADPRPRNGVAGVQAWDAPGVTVSGALDVHSGAGSVADPRLPEAHERPDPPPVIIALDGTWHRPLTTLELAALQGFPLAMPDGSPLLLDGKSDSKWRERIGNAVPPPSARAIGEQILQSLLAGKEAEFALSCSTIWVSPEAVA